MDSVTQMALGAAVGGGVMGRRAGAKAFLWGAVVGTLPDLDSFYPYGNPVADFTYHRGVTHALFWQTLAAPVLAWLIHRFRGRPEREPFARWLLAVWLVLVTHALLDAFTIYGTQLALPFTDYPFGLGSIFIIDPLYTLPLLVGIAFALARRRHPGSGWYANALGLVVSSAYLAWSVAAQQGMEAQAREALAREGIAYDHMLATPTPFNTVLWRIVAVGDDAYWEGYRRVGQDAPVDFIRYENESTRLARVADTWAVKRLKYFTKGFYATMSEGDALVLADLRMGLEPAYAFAFVVARDEGGQLVPVVPATEHEFERPPLDAVIEDLAACALGGEGRVIPC